MRTERSAFAKAVRPEKRFAPSRESFVVERLAALKRTVAAVQAEHPEILSFMLFGSMSRGKPRPESDIDGYLFVDATAYEDESSSASSFVQSSSRFGTETLFPPEIAKSYSDEFTKRMSEESGMDSAKIKEGLKVRPISERIIMTDVAQLIKTAEAELAFAKARQEWEDAKSHGNLIRAIQHRRNEPKQPHILRAIPSTALLGMFHLDVGGGIRAYRAKVLEELMSHGEAGERAWSAIIQSVEMAENYWQTTDKHYPRTLKHAHEMYGLKKGEP